MRALSIKQPWASLIVRAGKDIENRDWRTNFRGIVAVHASAKLEHSEMQDACGLMRQFIPGFSAERFELDVFPLGSIIGAVQIVDCVERSDSPWFLGVHGFVLAGAVAFERPLPCRGALGFWDVPGHMLPDMREQYRAAVRLNRSAS